jgi:DNA mismatch repair protein MutS
MSKIKKSSEEDGIYNEYFKYTKENEFKYGKRSCVLMQVGSFFEIYGTRCSSTGDLLDSQISEISELCQLNIADKKNGANSKGNIVMAGFQTYLLEKYIPKLTDSGYTVVVYIQEKESRKDGKYNRVLDKVYSPGTYISYDNDSSPQITNNIMCIWMHLSKPILTSNSINLSKIRDTLIYGVSVVNIFTGKSSIFENKSPFLMNNATFDELERYVSVYSPSEIIILSPFSDSDVQKIIQYTGIKSPSVHKLNTDDLSNQKIINCSNQKYIKQVLSTYFNEETYDICSEFNDNIMATQSFCYLLNFIQEHNSELVRKISIPIFNNTSDRMILANHTLMQLNIIDEGSMNGKTRNQYSSVLSFLNKCCSPLGKRKFQYQLTNPTFDEEWLNEEYKMTDIMLQPDNYLMIESFRKLLLKMRDVEKICRQIVLKKIYPSSIAHLHKTIEYIQQINVCLFENPIICNYLCKDFTKNSDCCTYMDKKCFHIMEYLNKTLVLEVCKTTNSMNSFDENIIQKGVSDKLDKTIDEYLSLTDTFTSIKNYLNELMQNFEKSPDTEYVKIHETEKSGLGLQITSKRSKTLQTILNNLISSTSTKGMVTLGNGIGIDLSDIKFRNVSSSSANMDIESQQLNSVCKRLYLLKESMNAIIAETYLQILTEIENNWLYDLEQLTSYISKLDVLQCKVYLAKEYNYCRPQIDETSEKKAFVNISDLRHCLIEHIQKNEIYVTNNVQLGEKTNGILLYGTNAVGKTSLIRAIGVSVIMAQSGMYVPCSKFVYKPYTAIFSRILGNDNIFKGLSTFAVEMSELRVILKMADENSLILGDELCSGTETESALSIFVSGLIHLHKKNSSFIFATHFHEIVTYDEIKSLNSVQMKHMAVHYDRELDCLVYDRKLKDGSGPRIYGLEVCKSLYLEDDFLELAYSLRNKYYPDSKGELSNSPTIYNAEKIRGLCEICKTNLGEEIHHLQHQKDANENGFIGSFHKNHTANLVSICQTCHDKMHLDSKDNVAPKIKKKTTKGYVLK